MHIIRSAFLLWTSSYVSLYTANIEPQYILLRILLVYV